jgi:3-methyladenine DNA glycosylase AlkC
VEPFKNFVNAEVVEHIARCLHNVWPGFDRKRFAAAAKRGLQGMELKQRILHVAAVLADELPQDFARACGIVEASLASMQQPGDDTLPRALDDGLSGWAVWCLNEWVARAGQAHPERALACLHELTQRSSSEFAIRPFLHHDAAATLVVLQYWTRSPLAGVRRLCSEGTRPRLPWGMRLTAFVGDPSPCLPLLHALVDDPCEDVRRSVANHLNDIAKDHPQLAIDVAAQWLAERDEAHRRRVVRHALRTLIKAGDPQALALMGVDPAVELEARALPLSPRVLKEGGELQLGLVLRNPQDTAVKVVVDYAIHFLKANGSHGAKVFKWFTRELQPGESLELHKAHRFIAVTTRRHYAGTQHLDLRVNGRALSPQSFELEL